jgi:Ca2+-binding RTX toxin-like protein
MGIQSTTGIMQITSGTLSDSQDVTALTNGNYVIVYSQQSTDGSGRGIFAQIFDSSGTRIGAATQINTYVTNDQVLPSVAALSGGGYVIGWTSAGQDGASGGIYTQRFNASGVAQGTETLVNTATAGNQSHVTITGLAAGGYVVAWSSDQNASDSDIFSQRFNASGVAQGGETRVNTTTSYDQFVPVVASLSGGGYVVVWETTHLGPNGQIGDILAQQYDASGVAVGSEIAVTSPVVELFRANPTVSGLSHGGFVIGWTEQSAPQVGSSTIIQSEIFNSTGARITDIMRVNSAGTSGYDHSEVMGFADGSYLFTYANGNTYYQRFEDSGARIGVDTGLFGVNGYDADLAVQSNGSYVITWANTANISQIQADFFIAAGTGPTTGDDLLSGTTGDDTIDGLDGNDFIQGNDGKDVLHGSAGNDQLIGGLGDDTLYGDSGNDIIWGESDNDQIIGGTGDDRLYGQIGNDTIWGEDGNDIMNGGDGDDQLYGQDGSDIMHGDAGNDLLDGGNNNDTLDGGDGADQLIGGAGADNFYFSSKTAAADYVYDFSHAQNDHFIIQASEFNMPAGFRLLDGVGLLQGAGVVPVAATATFYFDTSTKALWFDSDGTGSESGHVIAFLLNSPTLAVNDFVFI